MEKVITLQDYMKRNASVEPKLSVVRQKPATRHSVKVIQLTQPNYFRLDTVYRDSFA